MCSTPARPHLFYKKKMMERWLQFLLILVTIQGKCNTLKLYNLTKAFISFSRSGYSCAICKEPPTAVCLYFYVLISKVFLFFFILTMYWSSIFLIHYFNVGQPPGFTCPPEDGYYTLNNKCTQDYYLCVGGIVLKCQVRTRTWTSWQRVSLVFKLLKNKNNVYFVNSWFCN